ncbi:MAG TPA: histidine kinase dimerization/phospho-acceptor domain-containing protein [Chloroflexota bacterium]
MSFSVRLWILTIVSFSAFTAWIFVHDDLIPGLTNVQSHAAVAVVAWFFGIAGTLVIERFHRRAETLAEKSARDQTAIQLAGAVAHELNQPLTIIVSTAEILARRDSTRDDVGPYLAQMVEAAERASDIVQKLEHVTEYRTKSYVGSVRIVDLDNQARSGD